MAEIDVRAPGFSDLLGVMIASHDAADVCALLGEAHKIHGPNFAWGETAGTVVRFGDYNTTRRAFDKLMHLKVFENREPYVRAPNYSKKQIPALIFSVIMQNTMVLQALIDLGLALDVRFAELSRWGEDGTDGTEKRAALHFCAQHAVGAAMARALLAAGAEHSPLDSNLDTPAHAAARLGHVELLNVLLDAGADPLAVNRTGESVIDAAGLAPNNPALALLQAHSSRGLLRDYARARERHLV